MSGDAMAARPVYVSTGVCDCGRMDCRLYQIPGTAFPHRLHCARCLAARGYAVPVPRTADDIESVDGVLRWKR